MDYSLLQFDALKFVLGVHLHGGGVLYLTEIFFNVKPFRLSVSEYIDRQMQKFSSMIYKINYYF